MSECPQHFCNRLLMYYLAYETSKDESPTSSKLQFPLPHTELAIVFRKAMRTRVATLQPLNLANREKKSCSKLTEMFFTF